MAKAKLSAAAARATQTGMATIVTQGGSVPPPRGRSDAGKIQFSDDDLAMLRWIGEQYVIRLDILAYLQRRSPGASRQWLRRMRRGRMLDFKPILFGETTYAWLKPLGYRAADLPYEYWEPSAGRLRHLRYIGMARILYQEWQPTAIWECERKIRRDVMAFRKDERLRGSVPHLPDGRLVYESGHSISIEVELSRKPANQTLANMLELPEDNWCQSVHYIAAPAAAPVVRAAMARARAHPIAQRCAYYAYALGSLDHRGFVPLDPPAS